MYLELYITILFPQINIRGKNLPTFSVINVSLKMKEKVEIPLPLNYKIVSVLYSFFSVCLPLNIKHPLQVHKKEEQVVFLTYLL